MRPAAGRAAALLLALLALLAACTSGPDGEPDCGDLCVEPDPVRVGVTVALSGPLEAYGRAQLAGVQAAVDDAGPLLVGVEQREVEVVTRDDRGDASIAGQWVLQLVRSPDPVVALLAPCAASPTVVRVAEQREVPLLSGCGPTDLAGAQSAPLSWSWQVGPTEADRAGAVLAELRGASPVAVFVSPGHSQPVWVQAAAAAGVRLVGPLAPEPGSRRTDWGGAVSTALAAGAGAVVAVTDPPQGADLRRALAATGLHVDVAFATAAALTDDEATEWHELADRVLTDALTDDAVPRAEEAVTEAAADVTRRLLDAVRRTGSARPDEIARALAEADLRAPYRLAEVTGTGAAPLPP